MKNLLKTSLVLLTTIIVFIACGSKHIDPIMLKNSHKEIEVLKLGEHKIHTFYGVSNSHIIETPKKLIMIDAQFNFKLAKKLNSYIKSLNKPLDRIILSHAHPDHWFGSEIFKDTKIVSTQGVKTDLKNHGERYIKIMKPKLKDNMPDNVIILDEIINLGNKNWDGLNVILEEYTEHESHHSIAIKIPKYGVMIGQDLFYHNTHLVASDKNRNKNWAKILKSFYKKEASNYPTILVGHGTNTNPEVFNEDIAYLEKLEEIIESGATMEETKAALIKEYPNKKYRGFINITVRNLFKKH